jgi:uncharacterized protein (DUF58 family)
LSISSFKTFFRKSRFFLVEPAGEAPVTLNYRLIFIFPTVRGMGFAFLLCVLFLVAFVYNNNLVYLLTFWLASIFFISILHCFNSLAGLVLEGGFCRPVFAGESVSFVLYVVNPTPAERPNLVIGKQRPERMAIMPRSKTRVVVHLPTQTRGWYPLGTITISSTYPMGLFRSWAHIRFDMKALVYPKPSTLRLPFPEAASIDSSQEGTGRKGDEDFHGFREYQTGDSGRRIHWKAFAKGQGLLSKEYAGEGPAQIWLKYGEAPGQDVEERLSRLCRWIIDAEEAGIAYGLSLPGLQLAPDCGERHRQKCLEALALF